MVKKGVYIKAFSKMTWETACNPSSWKHTQEKQPCGTNQSRQPVCNPHGDSPHGDFTNNGGETN